MSKNLGQRIEKFSSENIKLAAKMGSESADKSADRVRFSHAIVEEAKARSGYIIEKRVGHSNVTTSGSALNGFVPLSLQEGWMNVAGKWVRAKMPYFTRQTGS